MHIYPQPTASAVESHFTSDTSTISLHLGFSLQLFWLNLAFILRMDHHMCNCSLVPLTPLFTLCLHLCHIWFLLPQPKAPFIFYLHFHILLLWLGFSLQLLQWWHLYYSQFGRYYIHLKLSISDDLVLCTLTNNPHYIFWPSPIHLIALPTQLSIAPTRG